MKHLLIVLFILHSLMFSFVVQVAQSEGAAVDDKPVTIPGLESSSSGKKSTTSSLYNPLGNEITIQGLIGRIINGILGLVGSIAFLMYIWGGLKWMTAHGEKEGVQQGADTLKWATIGLVVVFSSYAIINFVLASLGVV